MHVAKQEALQHDCAMMIWQGEPRRELECRTEAIIHRCGNQLNQTSNQGTGGGAGAGEEQRRVVAGDEGSHPTEIHH